jgi:high-affinity iron transporter
MYIGGVRINLGRFFRVAGVLLVVFGAAMLRHSVHEFEEVGLIPPIVEHLWNTGRALPDSTGLGSVLQALFGYTAKPSLTQLLAFVSYYLVVGLALLRPWRRTDTSGGMSRAAAA